MTGCYIYTTHTFFTFPLTEKQFYIYTEISEFLSLSAASLSCYTKINSSTGDTWLALRISTCARNFLLLHGSWKIYLDPSRLKRKQVYLSTPYDAVNAKKSVSNDRTCPIIIIPIIILSLCALYLSPGDTLSLFPFSPLDYKLSFCNKVY